jgi:tripartite-type tricarboxylate transporter receptor subunit TctC
MFRLLLCPGGLELRRATKNKSEETTMRLISRRALTAGLAASATIVRSRAEAQTATHFPSKAIKVVVPFAAGGGADYIARLLAPKMTEALGQPVIIDNRPGAGTTIANDLVAKSPPDGHTLLQVNRDMAISPSTYASLPYDTLRSFTWIGNAVDSPFILAVNPSVPAKTLLEFAAFAKSKPGTVPYGNLAIGGIAHLSMEALMRHLGIELLQVPYKGAAPALSALLAGEVMIALTSLTAGLPMVREGRLRGLAVSLDKRATQLPEVPTCAEAGGGTNTILPTYFGLAGPAGLSRPIVDKLTAALKHALDSPEVSGKVLESGCIPAFSTPEELATTMTSDVAHFGKLVKAAGIVAQ